MVKDIQTIHEDITHRTEKLVEEQNDHNSTANLLIDTVYAISRQVIDAGAVLIDEAGLVSLDKMGILFSSLRDNNAKIMRCNKECDIQFLDFLSLSSRLDMK